MNRNDYLKAKNFIYNDIQREINLAIASQNFIKKHILKFLVKNDGGGNFMAAMALLSYTEFAGKIKFGHKKTDGSDHSTKNFNDFFDELGPEYKNFRSSNNVLNSTCKCNSTTL